MKPYPQLFAVMLAATFFVLTPLTQAQTDALTVDPQGDVGLGTATPGQAIHVYRASGSSVALIQTDGDANAGEQAGFQFVNGAFGNPSAHTWDVRPGGVGNLVFNYNGGAPAEFTYTTNGNLNLTGSVNPGSSRASKRDIVPVDRQAILDKVLSLPIAEWSYIRDADQTRHMGPMAEEFAEVFDLGSSDKHISTLDADGVALAAIQALKETQDTLSQENAELKAQVTELRNLLESLAARDQLAVAETSN